MRRSPSHLYYPCDFPSIIGYPTDWERGIEHYKIDSVPLPNKLFGKKEESSERNVFRLFRFSWVKKKTIQELFKGEFWNLPWQT